MPEESIVYGGEEAETSLTDDLHGHEVEIAGDKLTMKKEEFLSKNLDADVRYEDGPASKKSLLETTLLTDDKGVVSGIEFDNVKITVHKTGGGLIQI